MAERRNAGIIKIIFSLVISVVLASFSGSAYAVAPGGTITFSGKGAGTVVFDGTVHASKGFTCSDCHESHYLIPAFFEMKRGADYISMNRMEKGLSCGHCHDGKQAFGVTDMLDCSRCHHK